MRSARDVRERYLSGGPTALNEVVDQAVARGEIDAVRATPRVRNVPFDLFRVQLSMTLEKLPDSEIVAIVDEVFLPLVPS